LSFLEVRCPDISKSTSQWQVEDYEQFGGAESEKMSEGSLELFLRMVGAIELEGDRIGGHHLRMTVKTAFHHKSFFLLDFNNRII